MRPQTNQKHKILTYERSLWTSPPRGTAVSGTRAPCWEKTSCDTPPPSPSKTPDHRLLHKTIAQPPVNSTTNPPEQQRAKSRAIRQPNNTKEQSLRRESVGEFGIEAGRRTYEGGLIVGGAENLEPSTLGVRVPWCVTEMGGAFYRCRCDKVGGLISSHAYTYIQRRGVW